MRSSLVKSQVDCCPAVTDTSRLIKENENLTSYPREALPIYRWHFLFLIFAAQSFESAEIANLIVRAPSECLLQVRRTNSQAQVQRSRRALLVID